MLYNYVYINKLCIILIFKFNINFKSFDKKMDRYDNDLIHEIEMTINNIRYTFKIVKLVLSDNKCVLNLWFYELTK